MRLRQRFCVSTDLGVCTYGMSIAYFRTVLFESDRFQRLEDWKDIRLDPNDEVCCHDGTRAIALSIHSA
jgi:hypothetical protein